MMVQDRDILDTPIATREHQSLRTLKAFYIYVKPLIAYSIKQASNLGVNFRRLPVYFSPLISPHLLDVILEHRFVPG